MNNVYPPVAFHFKVSFEGSSGKTDAAFKEVSGINMEMGTEEITEGGNNLFKHRVPTSVKFQNLVLKRGMVAIGSPLVEWCDNTLISGLSQTIETKTVVVHLLNAKSNPLASWNFVNAWPVKWSVSDLNSMNNEVLIETLELSYSFFYKLSV